ncbi:hypothetical protein B0J17DRAFT_117746 [Rhizoctonia solani]|nr:hypothetical protein B0J17DRAFT_117746 [Rhizoctonia solani]
MGFGPSNWETPEKIITQIFEYLSQNGVGSRRWRSLSCSAFQPEPLFKLIHLLNQEPAPNLHHLCLTVDSNWFGGSSVEARCPTEAHYRDAYSLSENAVPGLRHVELTYVSWKYVFTIDRSTPLLTGLTTLKLTAGYEHPRSLVQIHNILSANSRLELLELNLGRAEGGYESYYLSNNQRLNPVHLWSLRVLSLNGDDHFSWVWNIISIINTPFIESLSLGGNSWDNNADLMELFDYIITGQFPGKNSSSDPSVNKPIFPLVRELDISGLFRPSIDHIISGIPPFRSVTHLSIYCPDARRILNGIRHALPHLGNLSLTCVARKPHNCL